MKDMKKNETIERAFREYFDGAETPPCDLTQAKRELAAPAAPARRAKRGRITAILSSVACVLLVAAVAVGLLLPRFADLPDAEAPAGEAPAGEATYYSLASAQAERAGYAQLAAEYGDLIGGLRIFQGASNAAADYTLYSLDGERVLLFVHLEYCYRLARWSADVMFDLTDGALLPEEIASFSPLSESSTAGGYAVFSGTRTWMGEPVTDARLELPAADCYLTVLGREGAAEQLLFLLARG